MIILLKIHDLIEEITHVKLLNRSLRWFSNTASNVKMLIVYNKENLERQETNKYGRGTEWHLPKTINL